MLYSASGLLGTPPALEQATGVGAAMDKVKKYVNNETSTDEPKGPGWKDELKRKLDPGSIPAAEPWPTWIAHRRPGIVYYVEVIDKTFRAEHGGAIDVTGDTSAQGKIQLNWDVSPDTNLIQNGSPDAVALVVNGTVIDTVSYEGNTAAPYTEGSGSGLADFASISFGGISRFPDGVDTDQNDVDLSRRCITPGEANTAQDTGCTDPNAPPVFEILSYVPDECHARRMRVGPLSGSSLIS